MKKILFSLFGFVTLGLVNFSSAELYTFETYDQEFTINTTSDFYLYNDYYNNPVICFDTMTPGGAGAVSFNGNTYNLVNQFVTCYMFLNATPYTVNVWGGSIKVKMYYDAGTIDNDFSNSCDYTQYENQINTLSGNLATCETDLNSCQNDLINCGEGNTPSCNSGDIQWSSIFINDIQHESASNINITIPEEIGRDYKNEDDEFNLTVNGYNVDNEYISQIIENEKMTPTASDFSYLIENLGDYIPLLCIAGLMLTARYIIKKVF